MTLEEAFSLIDALRLSKKFASADVQKVLSRIRQSSNPKERAKLLKKALKERSFQNQEGMHDGVVD